MSHEIQFPAGMHIAKAAELLCDAAEEHGEASAAFNDITLTATRGNTAAAIVADFEARSAAAAKAYRESPAFLAAEEQRQRTRREMQARHDALMARLPTLDWSGDVAVLDWCCEMQAPSDLIGVVIMRETILAEFARHGFTPNIRTGKDFDDKSRMVVHAYLIGQALDGIQGGGIHPIIHDFAAKWRQRFVDAPGAAT